MALAREAQAEASLLASCECGAIADFAAQIIRPKRGKNPQRPWTATHWHRTYIQQSGSKSHESPMPSAEEVPAVHVPKAQDIANSQLTAFVRECERTTGKTFVLYDGSPTFPEPDSLWRVASEEKVTVFSTSPTFLEYSRSAELLPAPHLTFDALRAVLSTGSVLHDPLFLYVRDALKPVPLQSVSGGTDILGCFFLGHPHLPVHAGELQATSLGLDVRAFRPDGAPCAPGEVGNLVCVNPFPSRPLGLYGDGGERFHAAYFAAHAGVWAHGDLLELTEHGGARIHGRSDDVLNVRGIRIGPSEIARALSGVEEVVDLMALEQDAPAQPGGRRLVLLVVLREGVALTPRRAVGSNVSSRSALLPPMSRRSSPTSPIYRPPTAGRIARAARDAINGRETPNLPALRNPQTVRAIAEHSALQVGREGRPGEPAEGEPCQQRGTPREQIEQELVAVWKTALRLSHVELEDCYFNLGGDSLTAVASPPVGGGQTRAPSANVLAAHGGRNPSGVWRGSSPAKRSSRDGRSWCRCKNRRAGAAPCVLGARRRRSQRASLPSGIGGDRVSADDLWLRGFAGVGERTLRRERHGRTLHRLDARGAAAGALSAARLLFRRVGRLRDGSPSDARRRARGPARPRGLAMPIRLSRHDRVRASRRAPSYYAQASDARRPPDDRLAPQAGGGVSA